MEKKLSLVVSVYNEEAALHNFMNEFVRIRPEISWNQEVIFVNDGSRDKSLDILNEFADKYDFVKVVNFSRNFGHEFAMIAGIDYAKGDAVLCLDADLQHPLTCIPQIISKFEEGYDIVEMVRKKNESAGFFKELTSGLFYWGINAISKYDKIVPGVSDFFALTKQAADVLRTDYRERRRFLRSYIQMIGFKCAYIEYEAAERSGGKSHYNFKRLLFTSANAITSLSDLPLVFSFYLCFFSALAFIASLIVTICAANTYIKLAAFNSTIISLVAALIFLVLGFIGLYILTIISEVKGRPLYIVKNTRNFSEKD